MTFGRLFIIAALPAIPTGAMAGDALQQSQNQNVQSQTSASQLQSGGSSQATLNVLQPANPQTLQAAPAENSNLNQAAPSNLNTLQPTGNQEAVRNLILSDVDSSGQQTPAATSSDTLNNLLKWLIPSLFGLALLTWFVIREEHRLRVKTAPAAAPAPTNDKPLEDKKSDNIKTESAEAGDSETTDDSIADSTKDENIDADETDDSSETDESTSPERRPTTESEPAA